MRDIENPNIVCLSCKMLDAAKKQDLLAYKNTLMIETDNRY